ncbi:50S ribosomal protein-related [Forsythia ovata]|uniref:50S ribosomal protein-related n=1 Tax=Forsythia ovata TaxID=205694 RepID=A0ABD1P186_9LAMI
MATLQKFKLLATQCAVSGSPTRSPTTSPVIHLRRRKTLRMLLSRNGGGGGEGRRLPPRPGDDSSDGRRSNDGDDSQEKGKDTVVSHKLRDLFVSSPPPFEERTSGNSREGISPAAGMDGRRGGTRPLRPLSATFRQRLLRRAWRPVLGAIPESHYEN